MTKKRIYKRGAQNFVIPNVIDQYDMIITPENLPADQQKDFKELWRVTFHLYSPVTEILHDNKLTSSFSEIQSQVGIILFSLCYAYMICKSSKLILFTRKSYINLLDSFLGYRAFLISQTTHTVYYIHPD